MAAIDSLRTHGLRSRRCATRDLLCLCAVNIVTPAAAQEAGPESDARSVRGTIVTDVPRGSRSDPSPSPQTADTQNRPPPGLLGDLGGVRPLLRERGVELTVRYASESAYNPAGGERNLFRETGQLDIGATADLGRLADIEGGTFQATVTYRRGSDLGAAAGLGVLQQVQEVYGRGQTWRLTQFWYEQAFGPAKLKVGRSSLGEDFEVFPAISKTSASAVRSPETSLATIGTTGRSANGLAGSDTTPARSLRKSASMK